MEITKSSGKFNTYRVEVSYGELVALENALQDNHSGPVADELWAGFRWHLDKLALPGEDTDKKKGEEGEEGEMPGEELGGEPTGDVGIEMPGDLDSSDGMSADELIPDAGAPMDGEMEIGGEEPGEIEFEIEGEGGEPEKPEPKHESRVLEAKHYVVYDEKGEEVATIKAGSHNSAEKKAKAKYGAKASVAYNDIADFTVENHGSIFIFTANTESARELLNSSAALTGSLGSWQFVGAHSFAVDHGVAGGLAGQLQSEGYSVA